MLKAVLVALMATLTIGFGVVAWMSLRPVEAPPVAEAAAPPPPPPMQLVLAAARPITPGALLKPEDLVPVSVPADAVPDGARLDTPANRTNLVGAMARRGLGAQQAILPADVLRPSDGGFLAAVLGPEHRAVSVAVDAVSGTAGLIWPGDRVDLILTQTLDDTAMPVGKRTFGETVLIDLRVVAVDQQVAHAAGAETAAANRTVTLAVTPGEAERVAVAVRLGRIALAVRPSKAPDAIERTVALAEPAGSPGPAQPVATGLVTVAQDRGLSASAVKEPSTTWGQDVSPGLVPRRAAPASVAVRVYQGAASDKEFKFE